MSFRLAIILLASLVSGIVQGQGFGNPGFFPVLENEKWGFINSSGRKVIECQFDDADYFLEGLARVTVNGKSGFIDRSGKLVIKPKFDGAGGFSEGLCQAKKGERYGFIDRNGKWVIKAKYARVQPFHDSLAAVILPGKEKIGYIDREGNMIIPPKFVKVKNLTNEFHYGLVVQYTSWDGEKGEGGYYNRQGELRFSFPEMRDFSEGFAVVKTESGKYGLINVKGQVVLESNYDRIGHAHGIGSRFSEGLIPFRQGGQWGFMDHAGKAVVPAVYQTVWGFSEGFSPVKVGPRLAYINPKNVMVINPNWDRPKGPPPAFFEGLLMVFQYGEWGYINKQGKKVWWSKKGA